MNYSIVRPFSCIGPGQNERFLIPKLVGFFKRRGDVLEIGDKSIRRDFVDIRDAAGFYEKLIKADEYSNEVFHIASGEAHSIEEIIDMLREISGHSDFEIRQNSKFVRKNDLKYQCGSYDKAKSFYGFTPKYKIYETLKLMMESD